MVDTVRKAEHKILPKFWESSSEEGSVPVVRVTNGQNKYFTYLLCITNRAHSINECRWTLPGKLRVTFQPWGSNPSLKPQIPAANPSVFDQITALRLKSQPWGLNHPLEAQITASWLKFKPRASELTKHRSLAPSGPLPLSPTHTHIYSHRGNGYRWPSNAFATISPPQ